MAIVRFNNGDFYRLKNFVIKSTSINYGWGVHFYKGSDNNIIDSCTIDLSIVTNTAAVNSGGIVFSGSLTTQLSSDTSGYRNKISNNLIKGNSTTGGGLYYGIVGYPSISSGTISANKFVNNTIQDFYVYGIYWNNGNSTLFEGNTIKRTPTKTAFSTTYGFYLSGYCTQDTIRNNVIKDLFVGSPTTTNTCYGVYAINCGAPLAQQNIVDNNLFNFNTGAGPQYGFYMQSAFNFKFRNNTVAFHNSTVTAAYQTYGLYASSGTNSGSTYEVKNNIFYNNRTSTVGLFYSIYIAGTFNTGTDLSKNSYYGSSSNYKMANINGTDYVTYNQYKAYMGTADNTSSDFNPNFINATAGNFSPQDGWFDGNGVAMPHITKDVTGATRTSPIDIGAYEATPIALDIAYNSLTVPTSPYAAGVQNVSATIRNAGTTTITSATINWTVNGTPQTPISWTGTLAVGAVSSSIALGTVNVQVGSVYTIGYTLSNPNSTTESNTSNNTIASVSTACLLPGGTYTIDKNSAASSTNFTSISGLADYISIGGIGGALTFNVVANSGPYNNQVFLNKVAGVSATNTITFNGNGNRVEFNNLNNALIGIINVIGTDYVTFNQLHVKSLNASNGVGYLLTTGADYINILGCTIDISSVTGGSLSAGISVTSGLNTPAGATANNGYFNHFIGNTILGNSSGGPYYGIAACANNSDGTNNGYVIKDNIIRDFTVYGIYAYGVTGSLIKNNEISRPTKASPTTFYGIYGVNVSGDTIEQNKIIKPFEMMQTYTGTFYGMRFQSASVNRPILIKNNLIADIKGGNSLYGIYFSSISQSQVYHNTISFEYPQSVSTSAIYSFYNSGAPSYQRVKNNIFHMNRGGTGSKYLMYLGSTSTTGYDFRNNALSIETPVGSTNNYVGYYSAAKVDLAAWHAAIPTNPLDSFSVFANPKFRTAYTAAPYTPGADSLNNIGADLRALVPTDIIGTLNDSLPDPGAYKFDVSDVDAGLIGFSSPYIPLTLGTHNVDAIIKNYGSTALTSAVIDWEVNGVAQSTGYWGGYLLANDTVSASLGTYGFSTSGLYTIKAWSSSPNSTTDLLRFNDTIQQVFCTPLTGVLSINPSLPQGGNNFQTFGSLMQLLQSCGMAGDVTVNVSAGVYNEKLNFTPFMGLGNGNRLSFVGADSLTTIITSSGSSTADRATVLFSGADNISFSNFRIENTGSNYGAAVQMVGTATDRSDSIHFSKCTFIVTSASTSSYINPFEVTSLTSSPTSLTYINATALSIDSSMFLGGYYSMTLCAPAATHSYGHRITNSLFTSFYQYSNYWYGTERTLFEGNKIIADGRQNATNTYAMYLYYTGEGLVINANEISGQFGGYAIYNVYAQATASNKTIISNNMIQIGAASNTAYGMYLQYSHQMVIAHNAVNITSGSSTATTFYLYNNNATLYNTVDMINNIFSNPNAGYCAFVGDGSAGFALTQPGLNWTFDNNVYYGLGVYPYRSNGYITDLFATWKTGLTIGNDSNSLFMNPNFTSANNLRVTSIPFNNIGKPNTWVAADIDGNLRSTTTPDIGVSEFAPPANDASVISFALPKAPVDTGLTDVRVVFRNAGIATITSVDVTYLSGSTTFTQTYTGNVAPNGTDTVTFSATSGLGATSQQFHYAGGNLLMTAYTSNPNASTDANFSNDTFNLDVCQGMIGVYTINPSGSGARNYTSFANALTAINCGGALGTVYFDVANGTYNEQLAISPIPGASSTSWVVFRSASLNRNNVTLTYSPTSAAANYVVAFNGSKYISFEYMTVKNTNTTNGRVFHLGLAGAVNCAHIGIRYCTVEGMNVTTSVDANALIYGASGTNATDINIANNNLLNGSMAVYLGGQAVVANYSLRCQIDSNVISNQYYYGLNLTNRAEQKIRNNVITPGANSYYGVYLSGISNNSEIAYNKHTQISNFAYYIYGQGQYGEVGPAKFYGNAISLGGGTSTPLYITNSSDMRIYNNSINSASTSTSTTYGAISFGGSVVGGNAVNATQVYIVNNAINAGAAYALSLTNATALSAVQQLDYNLYYTTGASLLYLNGTTYTPATFETAKGAILGVSDLNSHAIEPAFTSLTNLAPATTNVNSWVMNGRGDFVYDLTKDIQNKPRSIMRETGAPDIGAYEFTPTVLPTPATALGSIGYGNTQHFVSYGDTIGSIVWAYSGTLPTAVSLRFAPGTLISDRSSSPNSNSAIDTAAHLMDAYWTLSQTGGSGFLYDIRLRYKPYQIGNIPSESDIKMATRDTSTTYSWWENKATLTYLDTVNKVFGLDYVLDGTSFTGTSDLATPLPVKLTNIRAAKQNTDAIITWVTASERNASQFIVERSFNRTNFERAGLVAATGNSSITNKYQFVDEQIGKVAINKTVYYRLRIVDVDGKFEYSPIVAVSFNEITKTEIGAYPNPFNNTFNVTINAENDAKATITVVDLYGKTVKEFTDAVVKGDNVIAVDQLQNLTPGVYFVKVNVGGHDIVTKLIKE